MRHHCTEPPLEADIATKRDHQIRRIDTIMIFAMWIFAALLVSLIAVEPLL